ncbi:Hypothetical predicted protein [Drosophila guanche]|uniref:Chitin-binding type-2 domain-containing protein n=1 Tax=Drosophila guanche TaxID=7266 RepID=A0A3B0JI89_DROGU|nr:Hypothetical predicted protein [Drosophila guanche]
MRNHNSTMRNHNSTMRNHNSTMRPHNYCIVRPLWEVAAYQQSTGTNSQVQGLQISCVGKPDGFLMASPTRCNDYYICRNQRALKVSCGDRYFNALKGICDLPENTSCVQS